MFYTFVNLKHTSLLMKLVDVILPLPLNGTFTYSVPGGLEQAVVRGVRVLVPLGRSKTYVAMVVGECAEEPEFEIRDIVDVLDESPMATDLQLRLWSWIAEYYMSPVGDVYKAALPSGLKAEDNYRPKTERCVALAAGLCNEASLRTALSILSAPRAKRRKEVFECFLGLSHWDVAFGGGSHAGVSEVTAEELRNESHCTEAMLKSLSDRGFLRTYDREVGRLNRAGRPHPENLKPLAEAQRNAHDEVLSLFMEKDVVLLHGVTSSGKTEIYMHLIENTLAEGRQVLYLLPEIALTVQITERLQNVFGSRLGVYHSKYSDAERVEIWKKQLSDSPYDVVLGVRSAVFLPFRNLGLVIVDEEHETSFKQQDPAPRYHARSVAIMLARMCGAKVLLGTATPSMESYHNALTGKYGLVTLKTRYKGLELPEIEVVDTKDLQRRRMMNGPFSPQLLAAVRKSLDEGRQVILFQNRRGFAPVMECPVCGWVPKCRNCDVSLTLHKTMNHLTCHYCGYAYAVPVACPNCGSVELRGRGYGTEKIEDLVRDIFPDARVARMDLDTTRTRNAYDRIISNFSAGRTNVLIGTQMVSKGLDFDNVSVVGILNADTMLNYPDFRAYEHAFMMMAQVGGRAGRKGRRGLVILQTKNPGLPVIREVVSNDFETFYSELIEERRMFRYPPFFHLVYVFLRHREEHTVDSASMELAGRLRQVLGERVLGPDKPSVARVKTLCIRKIVIKLENGIDLRRVRQALRCQESLVTQDKRYRMVDVYYDVDPL